MKEDNALSCLFSLWTSKLNPFFLCWTGWWTFQWFLPLFKVIWQYYILSLLFPKNKVLIKFVHGVQYRKEDLFISNWDAKQQGLGNVYDKNIGQVGLINKCLCLPGKKGLELTDKYY